MMVTVAPDMTPPLWSVTSPRMRPKLPCENRERENSNTPTVAPSTHIAFLARAIFNTEFMESPLFKIGTITTLTTIEKGRRWKGPGICVSGLHLLRLHYTCGVWITLLGG